MVEKLQIRRSALTQTGAKLPSFFQLTTTNH